MRSGQIGQLRVVGDGQQASVDEEYAHVGHAVTESGSDGDSGGGGRNLSEGDDARGIERREGQGGGRMVSSTFLPSAAQASPALLPPYTQIDRQMVIHSR